MDISKNTKLKFFDCSENPLTALNISSNKELIYLYCHDLKFDSRALDVQELSELIHLWSWNNELTSLNISTNNKLRSLRAYDNDIQELNLNGKNYLTKLSLAIATKPA